MPLKIPAPTSKRREIWRLAWPQTLMMVAHFFVGFVDVLVAGKLGTDVQAALGLITQSFFFFLIIAIGVSNGVVAAVSQSLGAGLISRAQRYTMFSLALALAGGLLIFVVGTTFRGPFLNVLQTPPDIHKESAYMLTVFLLVVPANYILNVGNAVFRAYKRVDIPLISLTIVSVVNTVADLGLGLGMWGLPAYGYKGLAWATFFSYLTGALFTLAVLTKQGILRPSEFPPLRWMKPAWSYLFKVAWPAGLTHILWQTGYLVLFAIVASLPYDNVNALAGLTAGMRVESALFLPAFAFNMTASVLVGHFLGAGDPAEAKRTGWQILLFGCGAISLFGVVVWHYAAPIAGLLTPSEAVRAQVVEYLFWNILAIPFTTASMILVGIMSGAGATLYNLAVFGIATWFIRLPLAYFMGHVILQDSSGVWMAMLVSQVVQAGAGLYIFQFKPWSRFSMRRQKALPTIRT
ncbi:MATE family efflux transporter [Oceanidesulfovibrio marinus]|uniref:Multidrug-efflux transporter n=1 Tax=Oceanidesulfovibrio marinus TaxID=370038 RepID=A0A6P1ZL01_9BACT|nr:MATE family efflux transporter [Oceanidesulfovibrio marinus]QJT09119.1 MATE family efflux transporter [Oceanidesulfovibrio marinus]TVM36452.1 MATE family efflux transporter [Oceanidesulfovibrio marinus]